MTADHEGCRFLLGLIAQFRDEKYSVRKKVALAEVTKDQFLVPNYHKSAFGISRLELVFSNEFLSDHFAESEMGEEVGFEMGKDRLDEFEKGIRDIAQGGGDWAMSGESGRLWFWA